MIVQKRGLKCISMLLEQEHVCSISLHCFLPPSDDQVQISGWTTPSTVPRFARQLNLHIFHPILPNSMMQDARAA